MMLPLVSCGNNYKTTVKATDISFLNDYKADIEEAQSIGIGNVNGEPSFVKQDISGEISEVSFVKKQIVNASNAVRKANQSSIKQNDFGMKLVECKVLSDFTFLKYGANIDEKYLYPYLDNIYGVYFSSIPSNKKHIPWYKPGDCDFYRIFRKIGDSFEYIKDGLFYSNDIIQSFILDNRTGYLYYIDFYCTATTNSNSNLSWVDVLRYGEEKTGFFSLENNRVTLTLANIEFVGNDINEYEPIISDLDVKVVDDNLFLTEIGTLTDVRDKYGQYFISQNEDVQGEVIIENKHLFAGGKDGNGKYSYDGVFLNNEFEAIIYKGDKFYKFGDNFEKEEVLIPNGTVMTRISEYDNGYKKEGISFVANNHYYELATCEGDWSSDRIIRFYSTFHISRYDRSESDDLFYFPNYDVNNVVTEDFGCALAINSENQLVKTDLIDFYLSGKYKNEEVLIENVSLVKWHYIPDAKSFVIKATTPKTIFAEEKDYYVYYKDGSFEIVEDESKANPPEPKTYVLTPINKD